MNMKREITIYNYYGFERDFLKQFIIEAEKKNFSIKVTENIDERSDIGIYMQHYDLGMHKFLNVNSNLSICIFHDMMELHSEWPNKWIHDRWDIFDVAIIPNNDWSKRWKSCSWSKEANPKIGVYNLGWPKIDHLFKDPYEFAKDKEIFLNNLNLKYKNTIFYAPSYERDNKQGRVINLLNDMPVNIIIKQAFDNKEVPEFYENIRKATKEYGGKYENVYILDPLTDIQLCFSIADVIISDESSVMVEGLLFNIPSISVLEWNVGFSNYLNKPLVPFNWIYTVNKEYELKDKIKQIIKNKNKISKNLNKLKDNYFSEIGISSDRILELIQNIISNKNIDINRIKPMENVLKEEEINDKFKLFLDSLNSEEKKLAIKIKKYLLNLYLYLMNNYNDINNHEYIIWGASSAGNLVYKLISILIPEFRFKYYIDKFKTGNLNSFEIKNINILNKNNKEFVIISTTPGKIEALSTMYKLGKKIGEDFLAL